VESAEAEAIFGQGREVVIEVLVGMARRIEELERRVGMNSKNSSRPPSQDPPGASPRAPRKSSGRKRGGQKGHPGRYRKLVAPGRLSEPPVQCWPERCGDCKEPLGEGEDAAPVWRHQVFELPEVSVEVLEYRMHRVRCDGCGAESRADLPGGVSHSSFGPRLCAFVVKLSVAERLSHRQIASIVSELVGCEISVGSIAEILTRAGDALAENHSELVAYMHGAPVLNIDETSWRGPPGKRWYCWGAFTENVAVFLLRPSRARAVATLLLGEDPCGIVCSDRYSAYAHLDPAHRQACLSHVLRDFQSHSQRPGAKGEFGTAGLQLLWEAFTIWHAFQAADHPRVWLTERMAALSHAFGSLIEMGLEDPDPHTSRFAREISKLDGALWTYTHTDGVAPTNNHAERMLRPAVIKRKLSGGSRSTEGATTSERLMSAAATCRLQARSFHEHLTETFTLAARGLPAPSLLPATAPP
jgi:transposase